MKIHKDLTFNDLQAAFQAAFPGLKLGFYNREHLDYAGSPPKAAYPGEKHVGDIKPNLIAGEIELAPTKTVAELEHEFEYRFGLHAQVLRRSDTLWLQTTSTDDWTLEVQNNKGMHSVQSDESVTN